MPLIDLHCDLLGCIDANDKLGFDSPETRCSLPMLLEAGMTLQTLAVAAITAKGSSKRGEHQLELYKQLLQEHADQAHTFSTWKPDTQKLHFIFAIENASTLVEEDEPLAKAFERLDNILKVEKVLYLSLTWNDENRFGGGNSTEVGLKRDGKALLEVLSDKGIAIDLSHTSDALAFDILNYIDKQGLSLQPMASHSNFRAVVDQKRNLSDELAQEIHKRSGVIGLNFVRRFLGDGDESFIAHIDHAIKIGCIDSLAFGSDYYGGFYEGKTVDICPGRTFPTFQPKYPDASAFPKLVAMLEERYGKELIEAIAYKNASCFIEDLMSKSTPNL